MTARRSTSKKVVITIFQPLLSLAVVIWFWPSRWIRHNRFLFRLKNPRLKPIILSLPFIYLSLAFIVMKKEFDRLFARYALQKYAVFTRHHYSEGGLGYLHDEHMTDAERAAIYNQQTGRIGYFLNHNKSLISYKNGDTFLDAGCGKGQNIRVLCERYPGSKVKGFDFSNEAVRIVRFGVGNNPNISVGTGDICDLKFLSSVPDASFDHVLVSHVIGFLSGPGVEETRIFRQQLIDQLVRICSASVIILDTIEDIPEIRVELEQNTRCIVHDRLMNYFEKYTTTGHGEMYIMFSDESSGLLYLKGK